MPCLTAVELMVVVLLVVPFSYLPIQVPSLSCRYSISNLNNNTTTAVTNIDVGLSHCVPTYIK